VGEEEMNAGTVTLKNMETGEQKSVKVEDIIRIFTE
jgi:histidyl-tRNA synthetase